MPYETRGAMLKQGFGPGPERFSKETWVRRDMCDHEPYPFDDDYFDMVVCTFTLEDVRDPIWVCREMSRIGKAGYVEVPSLFDELMWRNPEASGGTWVGHAHHTWLCLAEDGGLVFLPKFHSLHSDWRTRIPRRWAARLRHEERMLAFFWEGDVPAREWLTIDDYPFEDLALRIRERFHPSAAELSLMRQMARIRAGVGRLAR